MIKVNNYCVLREKTYIVIDSILKAKRAIENQLNNKFKPKNNSITIQIKENFIKSCVKLDQWGGRGQIIN